MDESTVKNMLDQLAEFHAQRDSIDAQKRAMLDEVKVPTEILALQEEANKRAQAIESEMHVRSAAKRKEIYERLEAVQVPEEVRAIFNAIQNQRSEIEAELERETNRNKEFAMKCRQEIFADTQAKTAQVYADLDTRKREIEAEFMGRLDAVDANIRALEADIKKGVKECAKTVKGKYFSAVYVKGRVTWNTDMLDGMIALVPQLASARKEGEPSITLRKV